jgi:hypothetical protein
MTDDLTTRLLDPADDDPHETRRLAADRIEALEAEVKWHVAQHERTAGWVIARDAVIAEALADLNTYSENEFREIQHARVLRVRAILSRVPQGAAEPSEQKHPGVVEVVELAHRQQENEVARWLRITGGAVAGPAAVRRVAPDRETLAKALYDLNPWGPSYPNSIGRTLRWEELHQSRRDHALDEADRLLASGVLGVPADQGTPDRETIERAITEAWGKAMAGADGEPGGPAILADAVLAVLVPADQVRAEGWDACQAEHGGAYCQLTGDEAPENPYRKAAGA